MSGKDKVRSALEGFIARVAGGEGSPEEAAALPNVADAYLKHYRPEAEAEGAPPKE